MMKRRVALRVGRTPEGWRRWFAHDVIDHGPGLFTIEPYRISPGFESRSQAAKWADENNCTVVS